MSWRQDQTSLQGGEPPHQPLGIPQGEAFLWPLGNGGDKRPASASSPTCNSNSRFAGSYHFKALVHKCEWVKGNLDGSSKR